MNKIDMKKVVKERITNQKMKLQDGRQNDIGNMAKRFFDEHTPKQAEYHANEAAKHLEKWAKEFRREFGSTQDMHGMSSAMIYVNNSYDAMFRLIREALNMAANGIDPTTSHNHKWLKDSPFRDEFLKLCEEARLKYHQRLKDLNTLEFEMISVITSAKSAKAAAEQLDELGITLDVPEAKKVQSNLPAVVELSVAPTLFNKNI